MTSLNDYQEGFLGGEQEGMLELSKAMQAGQITGRDTTGLPLTQEPLKAESLETNLKLLEFRMKDIKLFNAIPKLTAYNTVEEFLQLASYGAERGGFYDEGELSDVEDSTYIRRAEKIKYMQVTGEVTMQAQMTKSWVPAMTKEIQNKMMWIIRLANRSLTKADSDIIPQEFNSIYKQHASVGSSVDFLYPTFENYYNSGTVIDMRGYSLTQGDLETGAVQVDANYGNVDTLFAPTKIVSSISKDYYQRQRIILDGKSDGFVGNAIPKSISTTLGDINLMADKFMNANLPKLATDPATSTKAPTAPTVSAVAAAADVTAKYASTDPGGLGNVYYAVSSLNRYGESNLTVFATAVTLSAAHGVDLTISPSAGPIAANGYQVYRTQVTTAGAATGLTFYPIFKVSTGQVAAGYQGAAAGSARDLGYYLPGMEQCFIVENNDEVYSFKQLAPLSKLDLAVLAMSRRFITFLFGTPQLYTPKKIVRYINVNPVYTPRP